MAALFAVQQQADGKSAPPASPDGEDVESVPACVSAISDGLARPLAARLDWAVSSQDELTPLFRVMDVLQFYAGSMAAVVPHTAPLCGAINSAHASCRARADTLSTVLASRVHAAVSTYPSGVAPAPAVADSAFLLAELCKAVSSGSMSSAPDSHFEVIRQSAARTCVDTLVRAVQDSTGVAAQGLAQEEGAALQLNAAACLQSSLAPYAIAAPAVQRLAADMPGLEESVVTCCSTSVLADSGMLKVLAAVRSEAGAGAGAEGAVMEQLGASISAACERFVRAVSVPSLLRFDSITDPRVRQRVRRDTAGVLSAAYATVHRYATKKAMDGGAGSGLRSPAEVDVMLDLQ